MASYTIGLLTHVIDSHDMDYVSLHRVERGGLLEAIRGLVQDQAGDGVELALVRDEEQYHADVFAYCDCSMTIAVRFLEDEADDALAEMGLLLPEDV